MTEIKDEHREAIRQVIRDYEWKGEDGFVSEALVTHLNQFAIDLEARVRREERCRVICMISELEWELPNLEQMKAAAVLRKKLEDDSGAYLDDLIVEAQKMEREACAKEVDERSSKWARGAKSTAAWDTATTKALAAKELAEVIRGGGL